MLGSFEGAGGERGPDFGEVEPDTPGLIDGGGDPALALPTEHRLPSAVRGEAEVRGKLASGEKRVHRLRRRG